MKKALVILLILAVAGGAFAQVSFTGTIFSGMGIVLDDNDATDPVFGLYSMDNANPIRFNLDGKYANADGNVGASLRFRLDGTAHNNDGIQAKNSIIQHAYGWVKAFDNMLTINGGKIDNGYSFGTAGGIDTSFDIGAGYGLFAIITPMAGLDIGLSAYTRPYAELLEPFEARYHFGVSYTMPDTVTVIAQLRQGNGWVYNRTDALLGVKVLALADSGISTLILDAAFLDLQKSDPAKFMTIQIGEKVVFTQDTLEVGARFMQQLRLYDNEPATYAPDLTFWVWGQYGIGSIVPRLDAMFNMGSGKASGDWRRWDGITKGQFTKDAMNLQIRPSVQFRFGGTTNANFIELGYGAFVDMSDPEPATKLYHNIYVDYMFSF